MDSIKIDPYVAEIMKRNEQMAYLLGRAEGRIETWKKQVFVPKSVERDMINFLDEIDDYYRGLK